MRASTRCPVTPEAVTTGSNFIVDMSGVWRPLGFADEMLRRDMGLDAVR